jgi:lipopolysaccharide heptosyltransferase II
MGHKSLQRVLVIQTAFLGDVILATALIEKIHQHFPETELYFLLRKGNEMILKGHPFIRETIIFDKSSGKYINLFRLILAIRKLKFDLVINVQRYFTSGLITIFSRAQIKSGFDKNPLSWLFTVKIQHDFKGSHEIERNHKLIEWMTDPEPGMPKLYPSSVNYDKVDTLKDKPYICIAPASVWFTKQFPARKWIELLSSIHEPVVVYLLGSGTDMAVSETIIKCLPQLNIHNLCGQMDILDTAALMKDAVLNIVNDSAPMHIASAMNAPVCVVYCSTIPQFGYGPLSERKYIVEYSGELSCRPCGIHGRARCPEGHFKCALEIDTGKIKEIVERELTSL